MENREDVARVKRLLGGEDAAAAEFQRDFYPYLLNTLKARCHDGRSKARAEEIAADVVADCFGASGKEPLLSRYNGQSSLKAWLFVVGLNRLRSWWRSAHFRKVSSSEGPEDREDVEVIEVDPRSVRLMSEKEVVAIMRRAFSVAFCFVDPKDLAFLRTVYCFGFTQAEVAEMWNCDVSTVSRRMDSAAKRLHKIVMRYVEILDVDLDITWEDWKAMCSVWPNLLMGPKGTDTELFAQ